MRVINPRDIQAHDPTRRISVVILAAAVALAALVVVVGNPLGAASAAQPPPAAGMVERELIFGSELMSDTELDRYRDEINKLNDEASRAQYRERHRQRLRERARNRGVELQEPAGILRRKESR